VAQTEERTFFAKACHVYGIIIGQRFEVTYETAFSVLNFISGFAIAIRDENKDQMSYAETKSDEHAESGHTFCMRQYLYLKDNTRNFLRTDFAGVLLACCIHFIQPHTDQRLGETGVAVFDVGKMGHDYKSVDRQQQLNEIWSIREVVWSGRCLSSANLLSLNIDLVGLQDDGGRYRQGYQLRLELQLRLVNLRVEVMDRRFKIQKSDFFVLGRVSSHQS
jgi:hypothetical protein